jgi:hypothetical protein
MQGCLIGASLVVEGARVHLATQGQEIPDHLQVRRFHNYTQTLAIPALLEPRSTMITQSAHIDQMSETPLSLSLSLSLSRSLARSLARSSLSLALALAHSLALFRARARSLPLLPFWCAVDIAAGGWLPRLCVAVQVLRQWAGVWCVVCGVWCVVCHTHTWISQNLAAFSIGGGEEERKSFPDCDLSSLCGLKVQCLPIQISPQRSGVDARPICVGRCQG